MKFSKLSIVIPAYNEEDAIEAIIKRCLEAKEVITSQSPVEEVEIIVVSDGSVDKTPELAKQFEPEIKVIAYVPNRGYGAALKTGFEIGTGDLVSFLDADGTCDPLYFSDMVNKMVSENSDIVIGSRMGKQSKMPRIRRLGNTIFVNLIKILSKQELTDSASGMRVIKKDKLQEIYPLPDGLHFTPAMSVKALFDTNLKISEIDMTYEERVGESKLSVLKDGFRFLRVILEAALAYNPFRLLAFLALFLFAFASFFAYMPIHKVIIGQAFEEWMIYRFIAVLVTFTAGVLLLIIGRVTQTLMDLANNNKPRQSFLRVLTDNLFLRFGWITGILSFVASLIILWPGLSEYFTQGTVSQHWAVTMFGAFVLLFGLVSWTTGILNVGLNYIKYRLNRL